MIKVPMVRLIDEEGEQYGVVNIEEALNVAEERHMDLIEVSPNAEPPVCKLMDFGKYKYQTSKRQHEAKRHQKIILVKEIKLRPKTEEHDYQFKIKNALRFLDDGNKVKFTMMFRGREMAHRDIGMDLLVKLKEELTPHAEVEQEPKEEGRTITVMFAPLKSKK